MCVCVSFMTRFFAENSSEINSTARTPPPQRLHSAETAVRARGGEDLINYSDIYDNILMFIRNDKLQSTRWWWFFFFLFLYFFSHIRYTDKTKKNENVYFDLHVIQRNPWVMASRADERLMCEFGESVKTKK